MAKCIIKIFLFLLLVSAASYAQTDTTQAPAAETPQKDTLVYRMHKSPLGAVLRSAIIPGLGQFYNEAYWKVPVVWGFLGYYGYE